VNVYSRPGAAFPRKNLHAGQPGRFATVPDQPLEAACYCQALRAPIVLMATKGVIVKTLGNILCISLFSTVATSSEWFLILSCSTFTGKSLSSSLDLPIVRSLRSLILAEQNSGLISAFLSHARCRHRNRSTEFNGVL
jgi:hypothetical protein